MAAQVESPTGIVLGGDMPMLLYIYVHPQYGVISGLEVIWIIKYTIVQGQVL